MSGAQRSLKGPLRRHVARGRRLLAAALGVAAAAGGFAWAFASPTVPSSDAATTPAAQEWAWNLPQFFPTPRVPATNRMTQAKVTLGRYLFYEPRLSGNGSQSCGSCHMQSKAFTDGLAVAIGSTGDHTLRSSMPLANVGYNTTLTWANPSLVRLERQMLVPLFGTNPVEMGVNDRNKATVLARIRTDAAYRKRFATAFPGQKQPVTWTNVVKAISAFQRTMISGDSTYDRYLAGKATLTASQTRGKDLFFGEKAECHHCHGSFNLNDQVDYAGKTPVRPLFHNTGLYNIGGTGAFPEGNRGVFELTATATDMGAFRAQSLRNIAVTAPYMHDGSIATLQEVVDFYAAGGRDITVGPNAGDGRANPYKSGLTAGIDLTPQDKADLVAFLKTFTDQRFLTNAKLSDPFGRIH